VKYTRQGRAETPAGCLAFLGNVAHSENVKVTVLMPLNSLTSAAYALEYSQLSLNAPYLVEVSIDDFVDQFRALPGQPAANADGQHGQSTWIPVTAVAPPPADYSAGMYDPGSKCRMLYGGSTGTDVWILNLPDHITDYERDVYDPVHNGPSTRAAFTAVYNPGNNRMIVFGGGAAASTSTNSGY
jgi:hypothetical protein